MKMPDRTRLFFLLLFVVFFGTAVEVRACLCGQASTCEYFNFAAVSFVGKAIRIEKEETGFLRSEFTIFEMTEVFSGRNTKEIRIRNKSGFGCDISFEEGETYLIFAGGSEADGFGTGFCSGNVPAKYAGAAIEELRRLSESKGNVFLRGIVLKEMSKDRDDRLPLSNIRVEMENIDTGRIFEARTGSDGRFELSAPPGTYRISPVAPPGFILPGTFEEEPQTIRSGGCTESYFVFSNNSRVAGRLLDNNGVPVRNARVELVPLSIKKSSYLGGYSDDSDLNGDFSIGEIPVGSYTLSVNYNSNPHPEHPFPTTFYPAGSSRSDAKVLEVQPGKSIDGLVFRLPARLDQGTISGKVVWEDGSPAVGARIQLFDMAFPGFYAGCFMFAARQEAEPNASIPNVVSTSISLSGSTCNLMSDNGGKFKINIYTTRTYRVTATITRSEANAKVEYVAESEPFLLGHTPANVKLVLKPEKRLPY